MRFKLMLCGASLTPALLLAGCGMNQMSAITPNMESPAMAGRAFGGQQPVVGATISVVAMGTSGYGSTGTILASVTTDSGGNFRFPPGMYSCPQPDTPVYLLGIGGNSGAGENPSAVLGAGLGTCANGKNAFVIMNEVTTVGLAFTLAQFFSPTLGGGNAENDWFGGPSTTSGGTVHYSKGLAMGNNVTIPTIVFNAIGAANQTVANASGTTYTVEWQKINTIANILSNCVNSSGSTSTTETRTTCGKLFRYTRVSATSRPSDTLQAAVQMALFPSVEINNLYNLITSTPQFSPYLSAPPNDWTIGVGYTTAALGLAVDTGTISTLDIDASGRIWFPSNAAGKAGAAYFDPASQSFNGPFNSTGLVHPQQVAIDANGFAWYNDSAAATVAGYLTTAPMTTETVSLQNTVSDSLTVGGDNRINVGITTTNSLVHVLANISADRSSYALAPTITFPFTVTSMAGDTSNGDAVTITDLAREAMQGHYVTAVPETTEIFGANDNSGQVIFTGDDHVAVRSYSGTGNAANDGLCIYSTGNCYNFTGARRNAAEGIAISGGKHLWATESEDGSVLHIPVSNPSGTGASVYLNLTLRRVPATEYLHGPGNGGTATTPTGVGVDATGNVWMSNAGCNVTGCTPGNFTLTEIVGVAAPTITPVSAQITSGNLVGTLPTN